MWTCTKGMVTLGPKGESPLPRRNCDLMEVVSVVDGWRPMESNVQILHIASRARRLGHRCSQPGQPRSPIRSSITILCSVQ